LAVGIITVFCIAGKALSLGAGAGLLILKSDLIIESSVLALKKIEDIDNTSLSESVRKWIETDNSMYVGVTLNNDDQKNDIMDAINSSLLKVSTLPLNEAKAILKNPEALDGFDFIIAGDKNDINDIQNQLRSAIANSASIEGSTPVNTFTTRAVVAGKRFMARIR